MMQLKNDQLVKMLELMITVGDMDQQLYKAQRMVSLCKSYSAAAHILSSMHVNLFPSMPTCSLVLMNAHLYSTCVQYML